MEKQTKHKICNESMEQKVLWQLKLAGWPNISKPMNVILLIDRFMNRNPSVMPIYT